MTREPIKTTRFGFTVSDASPGDTVRHTSPTGARVVVTRSDHADKLADLASRLFDLERAVEYCDMLDTTDETEHLVRHALTSAILLNYGRAFSTDARTAEVISLGALNRIGEDALDTHKHLISLRNKYIAHSDNPYERTVVGLTVTTPPLPRALGNVYVHRTDMMGFRGGAEVSRLANAFLSWGRKRVDLLSRSILAQERLVPLEELYARPDVTTIVPSPGDAGTRRKRQQTVRLRPSPNVPKLGESPR